MEHEDNIEYAKGGRISPERSATDYPKGTLGVGEDGNVWINQPDKNGRLSWKPTEITKDFRVISFGFFNEEKFTFEIIINGVVLFLLRYVYNSNCFLRFTYPNGGADFQIAGNLEELLKFFNENFSIEEFDLLNSDPNYTGNTIKSQVELLFRNLTVLQNSKGLRKFEVTPEPKYTFKVGDRVKLPKTKHGQKLVGGMSNVFDDAIKIGQDYLVVTEVWDNKIMLDNELSKYGDYFSQELDKIELYHKEVTLADFSIGDIVKVRDGNDEFRVEQNKWNGETWVCEVRELNTSVPFSFKQELLELSIPKTPFQQIDFLNPSTEELDTVIKSIQMNADKVTFINGTLAGVYIKFPDRNEGIDVLFDQVNNVIKLYAPNYGNIKSFSNEFTPPITNESLEEIQEIYYTTLVRLLKKVELYKSSEDCEADPSLIISGQVKKFYDLNKPRIEKLKSEFSCKIIKALVSLSEYEQCGTPSKIKIPQKKEDLLSEIQNLKF